ncbi:MAG: sulfatase [Chloroflexi bacterium]|jgi:arylsulfatase A-like enzyme|nr:sulfatase [Chloroflexota bacterium]
MKAIMVMYDSLNRRYLPCYGNTWVQAPNFERLAERSVVFDNAYVGSMPCMPARRELHTGRYNLLHRSWGPLEPFDDSMPELLRQHGVHTHLVSDHQHYWEDGGCTYHQRYTTWSIVRGQEGDHWKAEVGETSAMNTDLRPQDRVNRRYMTREEDQPQSKTFAEGLEFLETNHDRDNWFLQIETFDPHEPFFTQQHYKDLYPDDYQGPDFDWPEYRRVDESDAEIERCRHNYAALLTMCDRNLGKILDAMDRYNLWDDTLLIVNTDHGFLLAEHDWWAKCRMPFYQEVAHTPLFIWDPRCRRAGERAASLVQTIDLAPTLLDFFGAPIPPDMRGVPLRDTVASDQPVREAGLFGMFGAHVNVTDGRYVYMRGPDKAADNKPLFEYTLMPTHMRCMFSPEELQGATLVGPLPFTKGAPVLKIPAQQPKNRDLVSQELDTMLFDLQADPQQEHPIDDPAVEARMIEHLVRLMRENDAPEEQYQRLGLPH